VEAALGPTDGRGLFAGLADHFKQAPNLLAVRFSAIVGSGSG